MAWAEPCPDERIRRIILIGVIERREDPLNIHALTRETCHSLAKRPHGVTENLLEFFDLSIGLVHWPILRLIGGFL